LTGKPALFFKLLGIADRSAAGLLLRALLDPLALGALVRTS
jgi:hypothetical protein